MSTDLLEPVTSSAENQSQYSVLESAAALAGSGLFSDYMVYEQNGECWFAGGVVRSVTMYSDRLEIRLGETPSIRKVDGVDLCQALTEELANWPGEWKACGWACFECAHAFKTPHLLNEEERAGNVPLLYLCQPAVSVLLDGGEPRIQSQMPNLTRKVREVLNNIQTPRQLSSGNIRVSGSPEYKESVRQSIERIQSGALEKVILSRRLKLDFQPDFVGTWLLGRKNNTPSRSFTLKLGGWEASGLSPEIVLSVDRDRMVTTEPLAGTRSRNGQADEDQARFTELCRDPKEIHEHAISVRLSVDEVGEVCEPSSIAVHQFMKRKDRGSVQHLGSTVRGKLRDDRNIWDAFSSLFPAVTASGIPKCEAFSEIRRHESGSRGLYAGAILRVDHDGAIDAALVLRSLLGNGQEAWLQAGAGVVSASDPDRELAETTEKLGSIAPWVVKQP